MLLRICDLLHQNESHVIKIIFELIDTGLMSIKLPSKWYTEGSQKCVITWRSRATLNWMWLLLSRKKYKDKSKNLTSNESVLGDISSADYHRADSSRNRVVQLTNVSWRHFTPAFQYTSNEVLTSFNARNILLHMTLNGFPRIFNYVDVWRLCWPTDTRNVIFCFPLTS